MKWCLLIISQHFNRINISRGSIATRLRCGGISAEYAGERILWKLVSVWCNYDKNLVGTTLYYISSRLIWWRHMDIWRYKLDVFWWLKYWSIDRSIDWLVDSSVDSWNYFVNGSRWLMSEVFFINFIRCFDLSVVVIVNGAHVMCLFVYCK